MMKSLQTLTLALVLSAFTLSPVFCSKKSPDLEVPQDLKNFQGKVPTLVFSSENGTLTAADKRKLTPGFYRHNYSQRMFVTLLLTAKRDVSVQTQDPKKKLTIKKDEIIKVTHALPKALKDVPGTHPLSLPRGFKGPKTVFDALKVTAGTRKVDETSSKDALLSALQTGREVKFNNLAEQADLTVEAGWGPARIMTELQEEAKSMGIKTEGLSWTEIAGKIKEENDG